jgi:hypothetical protein
LENYNRPRKERGKERAAISIAGSPELAKTVIQSISTQKKGTGRKRRR